MPKIDKEKRQRGKKHKKPKQGEPIPEEPLAGPSWIAPQPAVQELDQPFGALDPDLKAYLRSVDLKLNEWRDTEWDVHLTQDELQGEHQPQHCLNREVDRTFKTGRSFSTRLWPS